MYIYIYIYIYEDDAGIAQACADARFAEVRRETCVCVCDVCMCYVACMCVCIRIISRVLHTYVLMRAWHIFNHEGCVLRDVPQLRDGMYLCIRIVCKYVHKFHEMW